MSLVLAFLAGLLTSLSPCVIPLLPLVVGSASSRHRLGPVALCTGLTLSFSVFAVAVALATQAFNFDPGTIRIAGAVLLLLLGVISLLPPAQNGRLACLHRWPHVRASLRPAKNDPACSAISLSDRFSARSGVPVLDQRLAQPLVLRQGRGRRSMVLC